MIDALQYDSSRSTSSISIDLQKRKLKTLIEYNATYATIGSMNFV